jgi:hypothetical protein
MHIYASAENPPALGKTWAERQEGPDDGLISAWYAGRDMRARDPGVVAAASRGELPVLPFKGGVEKKIKSKKIGSLHYIAMWQGLRGEDLNITRGSRPVMRCAKTGVAVNFTDDAEELGKAGPEA